MEKKKNHRMLLICCHKNIPSSFPCSLISTVSFYALVAPRWNRNDLASYWQQKSSWRPFLILEETCSKNSSSLPDLGKRGRKFLHFSHIAILSDLPLTAEIILRFCSCHHICHLVTFGMVHRKDEWFKIQLTTASSLVIVILPALAPFHLYMTTIYPCSL